MNDTVILLVLAGIGLVFRWLIRQASSENDEPASPPTRLPNEPPPRAPMTRDPGESEQERVRRFLEALGAPPGSAPPPPVRPRPAGPRRVITPTRETRPKFNRPWAQPLPPLVSSPPDEPQIPPLTTSPDPTPPITVSLPAPPPLPPLPVPPSRLSVPARGAVAATVIPPTVWVGEMLRRRGSARQAIILREVLGQPRGLKAVEF